MTESDLTEREIRKRIRSAEHLIDVKKRELPKLKEKLMWVLYAQCEEGAQKRFMMIHEQLKERKRSDPKERDQLIALLERTLKEPVGFIDKPKTLE